MKRLKRLNYRHIIPDIFLIILSFYASLFLRLDWGGMQAYIPILNRYLLLFIGLKLAALLTLGAYDIIWRYVSASDAVKIVKAIIFATLLVITATFFMDLGKLPRSIFLIDAVLITILLTGIRLLRRTIYDHSAERTIQDLGRRTLIYGAGRNGRTLVHRLTTDSNLGLHVVGFIDDDTRKVGRSINGITVLGTSQELTHLVKYHRVQEIIIAISKPLGSSLRDIIRKSNELQIQPRLITHTTPESSQKTFELFRNVELSDLLNRPPNQIDLSLIKQLIEGKRILITGAGGSIGSELSRQVFTHHPEKLILLDHSEYNLFIIDQQLRTAKGSMVIPILSDLKDKKSIQPVIDTYRPEIVFHAAAYKHVHLCEQNPHSAILNNILGTKNILELCEKAGVETFVQISTDKAVNPAGVMGATKRACELLVTDFARRTGRRYCSVRFGNVLGSSGSLIPLLQKQIKSGEPVTITHQDMKRYFMLTTEAVSLVLTAAQLSNPGDVMILRMGDPIKIVDIAKNLITLMGKKEEQVPVIFTEVRPGEKMFEELYLSGNELKTEHPDILVVPSGGHVSKSINHDVLINRIHKIITHAQLRSKDVVHELINLEKVDLNQKTRSPEPSLGAPGQHHRGEQTPKGLALF